MEKIVSPPHSPFCIFNPELFIFTYPGFSRMLLQVYLQTSVIFSHKLTNITWICGFYPVLFSPVISQFIGSECSILTILTGKPKHPLSGANTVKYSTDRGGGKTPNPLERQALIFFTNIPKVRTVSP